jgi:hypothetical protein
MGSWVACCLGSLQVALHQFEPHGTDGGGASTPVESRKCAYVKGFLLNRPPLLALRVLISPRVQ